MNLPTTMTLAPGIRSAAGGRRSFAGHVSMLVRRLARIADNPIVLMVLVLALAGALCAARAADAGHALRAGLALAAFGIVAAVNLIARARRTVRLVVQTAAVGAAGLALWHVARTDVVTAQTGLAEVLSFAAAAGLAGWMRYRPAMGFHPSPLEADFADRDEWLMVRNLRAQLRNHLDLLDSQTDWQASAYVGLDAEVDVFRGDRRSARVLDLYEGLRKNTDSRLFVVLGDPGSGKSVSLRKLARDLLAEGELSGRIPVYVNFKEWRPASPWSSSAHEPSSEELAAFILESLRNRLGLSSGSWQFVRDNFRRLLDAGRFFLILDSFDEVPQLLDSTDASWLIRALSNAVSGLITGSADGRGIIASRLFRQPVITRQDYCRLDIRPLSDSKVSRLIDGQAGSAIGTAIKIGVLANRPDLAPAARNPLLLMLLVEYVTHHGELPASQYAMFRSHMDWNVQEALLSPEYSDLTAADIWEVTELIARTMFDEASFGLEMPLDVLRRRLANPDLVRIIGFLEHAKLGRLTSPGLVFSFVHRRFNEFFLVHWLREEPARARARATAIPEDGRWRDALALYAEVATDADAAELAAQCFAELEPLRAFACAPGDAAYSRSLHCLRFLVEAFRGRQDVLGAIQGDLTEFVNEALDSADILIRKNAVEAVGILPAHQADLVIAHALRIGDSWVRETAFRACRYLPSLTSRVLTEAKDYFFRMRATTVLRRYSELRIAFALSESFRSLRRALPMRSVEAVLGFIVPLVVLLMEPLAGLLAVLVWLVCAALPFSRPHHGDSYRFDPLSPTVIFAQPLGSFGLRWILAFLVPAVSLLAGSVVAAQNAVAEGHFDRVIEAAVGPVAHLGAPTWISFIAFSCATAILCLPFSIVAVRFSESRLAFYLRILGAWRLLLSISWRGVIALLRAFPSDFMRGLRAFLQRLSRTMSQITVTAVLFALGVIACVAAAVFLFQRFSIAEWLKQHVIVLDVAIAAMVAGMVGVALKGVPGAARRRLRDWKTLRNARGTPPSTRVQIALTLGALVTSGGRLAYVRWLSRQAQLNDAMRHPADKWPRNVRPNYRDDEASALLAQLEERWLGLAR